MALPTRFYPLGNSYQVTEKIRPSAKSLALGKKSSERSGAPDLICVINGVRRGRSKGGKGKQSEHQEEF
jgi:hypothetical protein